jgi:hypothetical protein
MKVAIAMAASTLLLKRHQGDRLERAFREFWPFLADAFCLPRKSERQALWPSKPDLAAKRIVFCADQGI